MSDEAVIQHVAAGLSAGVFHVHAPVLPKKNVEPRQESSGSGGAAKFVPFPLAERRPRGPSAPAPPPPADPSTFGDIDLATQVAVLTAAAAGGKPFCPE